MTEEYCGYIEIEAGSAQEAEDIAREQSSSGLIQPTQMFDGNTFFEADEISEEKNEL